MKGWVGLAGWPVADALPTSDHPSAAGRAQDRVSSPAKDPATVLSNQLQLPTGLQNGLNIRDVPLSGHLTHSHEITALEKIQRAPVYDVAVSLHLPTAVTLRGTI